ncbi:MAG TPA: glycoside hydrolase family 95 protein, partial [Verrucomicrobiae bacterium]|nr:glycoside hydrolase family 95 protein [Verrucomicrobiae bacterium]
MKVNWFIINLALSLFCGTLSAADLTLWYQQPAANNQAMNQALPIGNGRMGALVFGQPERERLIVNEDSLWTGGENPSGNYDTMGAYQVLGNVFINLPAQTNATDYRRELNLEDATAGVSYRSGGVKFEREFFCSHPAQVLVAEFKQGRAEAYSGSIELNDSHNAKITVAGNRITASGTLDNGMKYEWQLLALCKGSSASIVADTNSMRLEFKNCNSLTLLVAAGTDYIFDY